MKVINVRYFGLAGNKGDGLLVQDTNRKYKSLDDGQLLADGAYADIGSVDVAREMGAEVVIAINLDQSMERQPTIGDGLQAKMRALEICYYQHVHLRFAAADLVIHPYFPLTIDTLNFSQRRVCVAAGVQAVRSVLLELRELLSKQTVIG